MRIEIGVGLHTTRFTVYVRKGNVSGVYEKYVSTQMVWGVYKASW
jgi:hypothetical protein